MWMWFLLLAQGQAVVERYDAVAFAIHYQLMDREEWPGGELCYYPVFAHRYALELAITETQAAELTRFREYGRPELSRAVLDKHQLATIQKFRADLQVARAGIRLGLIRPPSFGEPICH